MALLDFPTGPALNDTTTQNGNTWKWNGTSWVAFNNLSLTSQVTGVLGTVYGGTGKALSGLTVGSVLYADTSTSFAALAPSTNNYVLATQGAGQPPYWKIDDSGTGSVGSGNTGGFSYYTGLNSITSGTAFSYIAGPGAGGTGGTVILTSSTMALIGSTITSGTWAGSAITLTYGGTNGTNSGIALSNQLAVYNNAGMAITQILSSASTGNSILLQASQNVTPQWVSQSTLLVGSATTAAAVVTDASTATRYLIGTFLNSGSANTTLSTGSGITIGNNLLTSLNLVASGTTAATSTSTGALIVTGGVGIGGSLWTSVNNFSSISGVGHSNSTITSGTWAGNAVTLTYGGTNGTNSGIALSNQLAVYNNAGMAITQILSSSSTGNSILLQASQNVTPQWVSQSTLLVGSATTSAAVVTDSSIGTRYLIGTLTNSGSANTTLSTGSGITVGNNLLTSLNLVASGTTAATSTSTGALIVAGGVGIGGSLWTAATNYSSISGLGVSNSVITVGVWAGTAITNATNAANTAITDDASTSSSQYITWVGGTSGNQAQKITSSRLSFVPNTGVLTATSFSGSGANLTGVVNQLTANTGILLSGSTGNVSVSNVGVLSLSGTANQVLVNITSGSATTGAITLTLPQDIGTGSSPQFTNIAISSGTNSTLATVGSNPTSMVNKQYVDNLASGLDIHSSVRALQFSAIGASYVQTQTAGSAATGAYLISTTQVALPSIDGVSFVATGTTQRILIAGGATGRTSYNGGAFTSTPTNPNIVNGIYYVGALGGSGTSNWILVRASDSDDNRELTGGTFTFVEEGSTYADSGWVCANDTTNNGPIQFGLDNATTGAINFTQFTGAAPLTMGQGLVKSGNTIGVKANIDWYGPVSNLTSGSGGAGYSSFSIGGFLSGSAGTSFSATLRVGTATTYGSGTAAIVLNETGFSMTGGTNTPRTLTITGDISLPSPTQYGVAYGTGSALAFVLNGESGSGASVLTQTNGNNPVYLGQSQLLVGSATTAARVVTDASTATRYLIGTFLNSGSANTTLSTGSGITIGNNLLTSLNLAASGTTASTSTSTGALVVSGGVGIGGSLWTAATNYASISGVGHSNGVITVGSWAGNAVTLAYGGTNNNISGIGYSYQIAVYNNAGNAITQIFSSSSTGNSILLQPSQDAYPRWASQSTLLVGSATTSAAVVTDSSIGTRYLIGTLTNSGSANTTLSTGSGITVGNNLLTSLNLVASGTTAATSTSTGALVVAGGVGIGGSLWTAATNYASISGVGHSNGVITVGSWAGNAVTLAYGGTNNNISGIGYSYQLAVYNNAGNAITQIFSSSGTGNSILLQPTQDAYPRWVSQSTLLVGSATTAARVVTDASTDTRYLIGTLLNSGSANTTLSTGSGITIGNNLLTSLNLVASGTTAATSSSTGALVVAGGVGIGGSLWTSTTNYSSISGLGVSNTLITAGVWAGTAVSLVNGGTNNNISGSGHSNKVAVYNASGTAITAYVITQGNVIYGATGGTFAGLASTLLPVAAISSNPPAASGAIGATQAGQLWWDSEYGVLKIYYTDQGSGVTVNSQWVDATPVLGSSGGGSSTKRSYVMSFGAGFTPTTGADTVQIHIPYAPDNTSKYYYIKRLDYRNETLSAGTGASFFIERFTGGNAAFTNPARIYTSGAGAGSSFVIGASTYTAAWTLASSGASFISSSGVAGSIISGDYLRLNFTTVGSAAAVSISMIIEEQ
jgi:hypothetical protein